MLSIDRKSGLKSHTFAQDAGELNFKRNIGAQSKLVGENRFPIIRKTARLVFGLKDFLDGIDQPLAMVPPSDGGMTSDTRNSLIGNGTS